MKSRRLLDMLPGILGWAGLTVGMLSLVMIVLSAERSAAMPKPEVTISASCRGPVALISVQLGPAPAGYPDQDAELAFGEHPDLIAATVLDVMGGIVPDGAASSTVQEPSPVPVTITWPDGTRSSWSVPTPLCGRDGELATDEKAATNPPNFF